MKHILFVDDEPNVIDGLRRMLRRERKEWDMAFAASAAEALALLEAKQFDVLVTDLQMPGMNGPQLLERVVELYPDMVRIVLSGHADEKSTTRAMRVAHQFLSKPTDAQTLKQAVARACGTHGIISDERVRGVIGKCDTLPSLPTLYFELSEALASGGSDARHIAKLISRDMAFSAKILQLVNSSFFGLARRVSSVEQTVALLGVVRIKALVLTESLLKQFEPPAALQESADESFWGHSTRVAELSRLITKAEGQQDDRPDQAFTAGLLHDIGKLILATQFAEGYDEVLRSLQAAPEPMCDAETRILGVNHTEVGAYLLGLWALPPRIVEAVALHHEPSRVDYDGLCALTAVHVANAIAHESMSGAAAAETTSSKLDLEYLKRICLEHRLPVWRRLSPSENLIPGVEALKA